MVMLMADVYLTAGWPEAVKPPGSEDWEASAVAFPVKFICSAARLGIGCWRACCRHGHVITFSQVITF